MLVLLACFSLRHVFSVAKSKHNHILSNTHSHTQTQAQCFVRCSVLRYVKVLWFHCYFLRKIWHVVLFPTSNWNLYFEGTFAVFYIICFFCFSPFSPVISMFQGRRLIFSAHQHLDEPWTWTCHLCGGLVTFLALPPLHPRRKKETTKTPGNSAVDFCGMLKC